MRFVVSIDPATTTGIALVGYDVSGPARHLSSGIVKLNVKDRWSWIKIAVDAVTGVAGDRCREATWVIETWSHHRNFRDATRLAQVQQVWIDAAAGLSVHPPTLYNVMSWQAAVGAGKLRAKVDGVNARKKHAQMWAQRAYGLTEKISDDVADALCMASVWIGENRHAGGGLQL